MNRATRSDRKSRSLVMGAFVALFVVIGMVFGFSEAKAAFGCHPEDATTLCGWAAGCSGVCNPVDCTLSSDCRSNSFEPCNECIDPF